VSFPIRTRLTIWYVALLAVIITGFSAFLLVRLRSDLVSSVDRSLDTRAAQIVLGYQGGGEGEFQDVTDATLVTLSLGEHGAQIVASTGAVLETSGDPAAEAAMVDRTVIARVLGGHNVRMTVSLGSDREPFRLFAIPAPKRPVSEVLVVATSLDDVNSSIHRLLVLLLTAGPAALGAAALVGWWLARKALRPVARMTELASAIGIERMDERVSIPPVDDELARLARTLNAMLDRLERGVDEKHRFVADASHELRTPLAVMRSELEVSLRSGGLPPHAREVIESTAHEVERMSRMVQNMLTLARMDEGNLQLLRTAVDLADVSRSVVEELRPLAEVKGIQLSVHGESAGVRGDRERLSQGVVNLVENAIKYTGVGGTVDVKVWTRAPETGITVVDTGPGIPAAMNSLIFDRFVRVDPARSSAEGGSGLGLAICREIMQAHGGRVWLESEPGMGSSFSIGLPLASDFTSPSLSPSSHADPASVGRA
jgi:heavy metal sensor kinase